MRCSSILLSAVAIFTVTQAIPTPAEAQWEADLLAEADKAAEEIPNDSDFVPTTDTTAATVDIPANDKDVQPAILPETSAVDSPIMATPETSAVDVPVVEPSTMIDHALVATPLPTTLTTSVYPIITSCTTWHMETPPYVPTSSCTTYHKESNGDSGNNGNAGIVANPAGPTTKNDPYAPITSCTTWHMESPPYAPTSSCTTYHKENNANNGNNGPTTTTTTKTSTPTNNYGAITSCSTWHMEKPPYAPTTSCTTFHKENNAVQPSQPTNPPANGATVREFCNSVYGNFTWCYSTTDSKQDQARFPSVDATGLVLPAIYATQSYKPVTAQAVSSYKDYAPWASGPNWVDKVYAAHANIIVATLWTTEWLNNDYPQYKMQAKIFNETASQYQGQSFYKVNIDDKDVASKLKDITVKRLPSYIFYRGGAEVGRLEGFQEAKALQDKMKSFA